MVYLKSSMQYVILEDNYQTGHILMSDIENEKNVYLIYKDRLLKNKLLNYICRFCLSKKFKKIVEKHVKYYFYNKVINSKIANNSLICFVMISAWYDQTLIKWLKINFKDSKLVMILRDTVNSNEKRDSGFIIDSIKKEFDLILSYDSIFDVPKYKLKFAPVYMSQLKNINIDNFPKKDIGLIAVSKDRIDLINEIYNKFKENSLDIYFYLINVPKNKIIYNSDIIYNNKPLDRIECLKRELASNCILEVLKGDAHSNTLRFWEAIIYNKKIITNCKEVLNSKYYNPKYIFYYESVKDIDISFIKENIDVNYHYNGELSPKNLLVLIEKELKVEQDF